MANTHAALNHLSGVGRALSRSFAGTLPKIDAPLLGVAINLLQLRIRKVELLNRIERVVELLHIASSDKRRGDSLVSQHPGYRHLRQRLPASCCNFVQRPYTVEVFLVQEIL